MNVHVLNSDEFNAVIMNTHVQNNNYYKLAIVTIAIAIAN